MNIHELHRQIFHPVIEPKFVAGEEAYILDPEYPDYAFKVTVRKIKDGGSVEFNTPNMIYTAIAPHFGIYGSIGKLVKADEVPANIKKLEW